VQDAADANLSASRGVAVREFPLASGHGYADYALFVDGKAAGAVEAKKVGTSLTGVEVQVEKYSTGLSTELPAYFRPLPFLYLSTGAETKFANRLDPDLDEFVDVFKPGARQNRKPTWTEKKPDGRWRAYGIDELLARDKVSLDIFWLKDESLEDSANLPAPEVIAAEIAEDLRAALEQFEAIQADLVKTGAAK
jgi:hypothetical protein